MLTAAGKKNEKKRGGRKMERKRVWHIAESEEECGTYSEIKSSDDEKPADLCKEVQTI